ncbi:hypothetical protein TGRH88_000010 [Toxoplasma gondii]|uniref:Uncharacterized protein n=1 Tax=Toxoplasma gondii TaxID=5811 RepID=A0A7J6KG64_TOXGO|nr:hypothetical protein TGRH88_002850 [Toxoplasma gondii]KAF4645512.1 hypothetical protein TGRH88_000010 [Toxoplasma gondii]
MLLMVPKTEPTEPEAIIMARDASRLRRLTLLGDVTAFFLHPRTGRNSSNADGLSQAAAHVLHRLATTTEGGVCRMAEAKYIGRRQEAVCPQAEIAVLVGEDQESTILVADERYVIMKDILSCPNAYEECHVVVQCVFEEPPVGLRFQEWEVGSADAAQTVAQWLEPHMSR